MKELKNKRIVFHGTMEKDFSKFTDELIGQGGDPNSCLGIFFAEDPGIAAEYAGEDGFVIAAIIPEERTIIEDLEHYVVLIDEVMDKYRKDCEENGTEPLDSVDFFETQDDYKICAYFAREHYLSKGIQSLQYCSVGSDDAICVALKSSDVEILKVLTYEEALDLSEKIYHQDDVYDQAQRFKSLAGYMQNQPKRKIAP
jgi:hypothetical protein